MMTSQVRVGVRARPVSTKDQGSVEVLEVEDRTIALSGRRFTYDHVFDSNTSQQQLYEQVSPSLLQSFLDGYNATVSACERRNECRNSFKNRQAVDLLLFIIGMLDAHAFLLFSSFQFLSHLISLKIMAYGQTGSGKTFTMGSEAHTELHQSESTGLIPRFMNDLFRNVDGKECQISTSFLEVYGEDVHDLLDPLRKSLPLREDSSNSVVCPGLTAKTVQSADEALAVLHEGTLNRTTAATLMNLTSSRSHAVFTVTLHQTDDSSSSSSRFTFVDLAGSERLKKTGCSGERAREGIEINKGLLALGNVINALADEERHQKKLHVPYRQSKLTRLLQDALGGNSQTLFLACVSGADTNASETLSTLHYANRARNIQNAPCRNVADPSVQELQRLQAFTAVLQAELVNLKFGGGGSSSQQTTTGSVSDELMKRKDVNAYLDQLQVLAQQKVGSAVALRKPLVTTTAAAASTSSSPRPRLGSSDQALPRDSNQSVLENFDPALLDEVNPDEELAILDQLLDLQQHDQEFDQEQKMDDEKLKQVEGELAEQEQLLLQLRDSLKIYHNMKAKYENLMAEVQQLEIEKAQLAEQLKKASADPSLGCSRAIKKEMEMVERNLARARNETQRHRQMYKKAEQEAQKCRVMEHKIAELKAGRAQLMKKQKEAAARHRELTEKKTREITALKRKDRNTERQLTKLQSDIQIHKRNLDKRQAYCRKLVEQKKQTETHLMKLLSMRQRELRQRTNRAGRRDPAKQQSSKSQQGFAPVNEEIDSMHFLLDKKIAETVTRAELQSQYEERMTEYSETMRALVVAVKQLEDGQNEETQQELEHTVEELELKVEIAGGAMEKIQIRLSRLDEALDMDSSDDGNAATKKLIRDKTAPVLRTLLIGTVDRLVEAELQRQRLSKILERKESVLGSFEMEVETLNNHIAALKKDLVARHSIVSGSVDPVEAMEQLRGEKVELATKLEESEQESAMLKLFADDLAKEHGEMGLQLAETKEKLTLAQVAIAQSDGVEAPDELLQKLQAVWNELGMSPPSRDGARQQIENCLKDTCLRKLEEAELLKTDTLKEIAVLQQDLLSMCASLSIEPMDTSVSQEATLLKQREDLQKRQSRLKPIFTSAIERRDALVNQVTDITVSLGIPKEDLCADLVALIDEAARENHDRDSESNRGSSSGKLSEDFLSRCDASLTELRMQKSKILADNAKLQKQTFSLISDMNLNESDVLTLVVHSVKRRGTVLPSWWNNESAEMVARSVATDGGVVRSSKAFSQHLKVFGESLASVSEGRRELSTKLRAIVERAQQTLLSTVDGEFEANEAYSSFHEALFRLPSLSKDFIRACLSEVEALLHGVEAMSQSEIEALTVVWEALNISPTSRGKFWGSIDEKLREMQSQAAGPFDSVVRVSAVDGEEWVLTAVKDGTKNFRELEMSLFKLEKIHGEVERLRMRQDAKSKIISLDSEVRILKSKLNEFEDKKCVPQRLTTKKNTSSNLLKEERFRKQMQSKYIAKLDQLGSLLKGWKSSEKSAFDQSLLSEDVRAELKNSDRNEFMHLRTVEYKGSTKRGPDSVDRSDDNSSGAPPLKRQATSSRASTARRLSNRSTASKKHAGTKASTSSSSAAATNRKEEDRSSSTPMKKPAASGRTDGRPPKRALSPSRHADNGSEHHSAKKSKTTTRPPLVSKVPPTRSSAQSSSGGSSSSAKGRVAASATKRLTLDPFGTVLGEASRAKENPTSTMHEDDASTR